MNYTSEEVDRLCRDNPDLASANGIIPAINTQGKVQSLPASPSPERVIVKKRHAVIKMPYIKNLSVNHYKFNGGKFTKPEVKEWMNDLVAEIQCCGVKEWRLPLKVEILGTFKDGRIPDCHNLLKIVCDSVETATGLNDKFYSTETKLPVIDKTVEPCILITITEI